jgi:hypothetical protein
MQFGRTALAAAATTTTTIPRKCMAALPAPATAIATPIPRSPANSLTVTYATARPLALAPQAPKIATSTDPVVSRQSPGYK